MKSSISQIVRLFSQLVRDLRVAEEAKETECLPDTAAPSSLESLDCEVEYLVQARDLAVEALKQTEERLAELRQRKNQHLPVYRLPHDVYFHLFKHLHDTAYPPGGVRWTLSHVSRTWREIALSTPQLWSMIDKINPEFVEVCLARSGNASLDITLDEPPRRPRLSALVVCARMRKAMVCVDSLLPHAHRFRSLSPIQVHDMIFTPLLSAQAPRLEKVCIEEFTPTRLPRNKRAFLENSPRLRSIRLASTTFAPLAYADYTGLKELELHSISPWMGGTRFFDLLRGSPLLEVLGLSEVQIHTSLPTTLAPICFPHLRQITMLDMRADTMQTIFSLIRAPPTLTISGRQRFSGDAGLGSLFPPHGGLEERLLSLLRIQKLVFELEEYEEPLLRGHAGSVTLLSLVCEVRGMDELISRIFCSLGRALPLPSLEELELDGFSTRSLDENEFISGLGGLPSIRHLTFKYCDEEYLSALVVSSSHRPCPNLESLTIENAPFYEETLISLAESRAAWDGHALKKLVLPLYPPVGRITALKLKSLVDHVTLREEVV
ncbi:hypothetical protein BOTBODRAFT_356718 [Botryobasidium botryosum FD-172 SS1]|uniref:Uncharacterized protein n=1 Tax=Botryobasidium botryosum (strain FD-172 SS1) TaxID=930990 RepID=A0A067MGZ8_BOTB1|nr:hypothetical protein BOTBODRAFT_356718 [Botryobasidium botryosum FD-172 SS1]